jgi:arylsulfatase
MAAVPAGAQEQEFQGRVGKTLADSQEYWPETVKPTEGAPNVLVWLIDDMGFLFPKG